MRDRSQTTPRRRGPKMPLPLQLPLPQAQTQLQQSRDQYIRSESPYYTIDNTEDIYGTTLLPSQRCYVDPWDLENYDYVRKKINSTPSMPKQGRGGGNASGDYYEDASLSPSPAGEPVSSQYYYMPQPALPPPPPPVSRRVAATMPRDRRRSQFGPCELECCRPAAVVVAPRTRRYDDAGLYGSRGGGGGGGGAAGPYEDYMANMMGYLMDEEDVEQNIYTGYGGFSSSSSTERQSHSSSLGGGSGERDDDVSPGFGGASRKRSKPPPRLEFPAPPPISPTAYDYCNPYATLPYCSASDCYECLSQAQSQPPTAVGGAANASLIYAAPSMYASTSYYGAGGPGSSSTLGRPGRRPSSSLYGGIYASKFGLSKKGLLQIDYSCSWKDLDCVIRRNY